MSIVPEKAFPVPPRIPIIMRPFSIGAAGLIEAATNSVGACAHKLTAVSSPATISLFAI